MSATLLYAYIMYTSTVYVHSGYTHLDDTITLVARCVNILAVYTVYSVKVYYNNTIVSFSSIISPCSHPPKLQIDKL